MIASSVGQRHPPNGGDRHALGGPRKCVRSHLPGRSGPETLWTDTLQYAAIFACELMSGRGGIRDGYLLGCEINFPLRVPEGPARWPWPWPRACRRPWGSAAATTVTLAVTTKTHNDKLLVRQYVTVAVRERLSAKSASPTASKGIQQSPQARVSAGFFVPEPSVVVPQTLRRLVPLESHVQAAVLDLLR
jgi:hypothetical protein